MIQERVNQNVRKDGLTKNYGLTRDTRPPKDNEPVRNKHRQEIYYCKHCTKYKGTSASVRFREHLRDNHAIRVALTEESASRTAFNSTIKDIFVKQAEQQKGRNIEQEKHLRASIQAFRRYEVQASQQSANGNADIG